MPDALDEAPAAQLADRVGHPGDGDFMQLRADHLEADAPRLRCDHGKDTVVDGHGGCAH